MVFSASVKTMAKTFPLSASTTNSRKWHPAHRPIATLLLIGTISLACSLVQAEPGEAFWTISDLSKVQDEQVGAMVPLTGWSPSEVRLKEEAGSLAFERSAHQSGDSSATVTRIPLNGEYPWFVADVAEAVRPATGYVQYNFFLHVGPVGYVMAGAAGNIEPGYWTTKLNSSVLESSGGAGLLRVNTTMERLSVSQIGFYREPLPRAELEMAGLDGVEHSSSEPIKVRAVLPAAAKQVSVRFYHGRNMSELSVDDAHESDLVATDEAKTEWALEIPNRGWAIKDIAGDTGILGQGSLVACIVVDYKDPATKAPTSIWTVNTSSIQLGGTVSSQ